jgi:phenylacetic acid degradation operon negative regulatory protein
MSRETTGATGGPPREPASVGLRPQSLLLIYFGDFVVETGGLVASSSVVALLDQVGVGEAAARATLSRMTRRGLLRRDVAGRRAYFGLTDPGRASVLDGRRRYRDAPLVEESWDGTWTIVGFSMPDSWQRERHDLRTRLMWAGFGMVQAGLWVAPRRVAVAAVLEGLDIGAHLRVFEGVPVAPTRAGDMVADAWDLECVAVRYTEFLDRWARPSATWTSALARYVALGADWLQVVRKDPRLPPHLLPADWPALKAETLFRAECEGLAPRALEEFRAGTEFLPGR